MFVKDLLAYLVFFSIIGSIAVPKALDSTKRIATKAEMNNVVAVIQLYEIEKNNLPGNLSNLKPEYFANDDYKKDAWSNLYSYDKVLRKLCSTNTNVGCKEF